MKHIFTLLLLSLTLVVNSSKGYATDTEKSTSNAFRNNILRFTPFTVFDIGVGVGISYERILDDQGKVSFILPLEYYFSTFNFWGNYSEVNDYVYASPGLKFYPTKKGRLVSYAVGPNLYFGYGTVEDWLYNDNTGIYRSSTLDNLRIGLQISNYLDFNLTPNFNLGFSLALGIRYSSKYTYQNGERPSYNDGVMPSSQFKFTLGYRF